MTYITAHLPSLDYLEVKLKEYFEAKKLEK